MEKSEPTLVPEWLKNSGNQSGSGSTSHLDDKSAPKLSRNNSFLSSNGHDFGRSSSSERTTSSYFHRSSSSNGSGNLRSYSFGRNRRDRDWEKDRYDSQEKDKSISGDRWHRGFSDSLGNTLSGKHENDGLRRSQSAISGPHGDSWTKKVVTDSSSAGGNNSSALVTKGVLGGGGGNKMRFERNFPSLGTEERAVIPEVGRVPSPGLSSAIQSLPIGTGAAVGGEKWTSALAEVPVLVGSNGIGISSVQQASSTPLALGTTATLNMAETVAQSPTRAPVMPQISVGTQRLEELAIKQSRQLIPVTPSMPKTLVSNSSDKQKTKLGQQQHPITSLTINHSKGDMSKSSNVGKLHVLKLTREKNGVAPVVKDNSSPTSGINAVSSMLPTAPSVAGAAAAKGPPTNIPALNRKPVLTVPEKRTTSQAQSRKEFFNLMRKKSMANSTSVTDTVPENFSSVMDTGTAVSPPPSETSEKEDVPAPSTPLIDDARSSASLSDDLLSEKRDDVTCIGDTSNVPKYFGNGKNASMDPLFSEEEEAAFLRSLGWEENSDEGGLTEEEISTFYKDATKYNSKPALRILEVVQPKFVASFDSQITGISSGLSSSDAKLES